MADIVLLDAGDAFLPSPVVSDEDRPRWEATAAFIVDRYNVQGVAAMCLGDRDLGLGRAVLEELVKSAKFPLLAANVIDIKTNKSAFKAWTIVERAGLRIGIIGLLSDKRIAPLSQRLSADGLTVTAPLAAMRALQPELDAAQVDFWVVLSQLDAREELELAETFMFIRAFIGGDSMAAPQEPLHAGPALSFGGGQKGKQLSVAIVDFQAEGGPDSVWGVGDRQGLAERAVAAAQARIKQLESQLEKLGPAAVPGAATPPNESEERGLRMTEVRRKQLETQLVNARTTQQVAQTDLEAVVKAGEGPGNSVQLKVFPMGRGMPDDEVDGEAVKAFRLKWPAPPGH